MTISVETLLVVSLMMAVFAAVATVGSSLYLGAGFERLRAGFDTIKKQTAQFADSLRQLDGRVDSVEKQGAYYFEAISQLEQKAGTADERSDRHYHEPEPVASTTAETASLQNSLICAGKNDVMNSNAAQLLDSGGEGFFIPAAAATAVQKPVCESARHDEDQGKELRFH